MQIDDYAEAIALTEKLKAHVPFTVRPAKEFVTLLRKRGKFVASDQEFSINLVEYSGDMGGIMCTLAGDPEDKEVYVASLTHLKIDPSHPLAVEVQAYQKRRIRGLKQQGRRLFLQELKQLERSAGTKKKHNKGFRK